MVHHGCCLDYRSCSTSEGKQTDLHGLTFGPFDKYGLHVQECDVQPGNDETKDTETPTEVTTSLHPVNFLTYSTGHLARYFLSNSSLSCDTPTVFFQSHPICKRFHFPIKAHY